MSNTKNLRYILNGTSKCIEDLSQKFFADCYLKDTDVYRLMSWEAKINKYLKEHPPKIITNKKEKLS